MDEAGLQALRDWLVARGATAAQIERAERECHIVGLATDLVLAEGATLSVREVAEASCVPAEVVARMYHLSGVTVPDLDAPLFTKEDVALATTLCQNHVDAKGPDIPRVVAAALESVAEAMVAYYTQGPELALVRSAASPLVQAETTEKATRLALDIGAGLGTLLRHHMRQAVARQRIATSGVSRRELARLTIGFVDLVGSTALQADMDPAELAALVSRFESRAFDVVAGGGGRLVKFIGDAIMIAAVHPVAGCRIAADLVAAFTEDGTEPRGGLAHGEVLFRHGDYYGPVVNLAARLATEAIPGEVLADQALVAAVGEAGAGAGLAFEPAGRRQLKGFEAPVTAWSLGAAARAHVTH